MTCVSHQPAINQVSHFLLSGSHEVARTTHRTQKMTTILVYSKDAAKDTGEWPHGRDALSRCVGEACVWLPAAGSSPSGFS